MVSEQAAPKLAKSADSTEGAMIALGVIVGIKRTTGCLRMHSCLCKGLSGPYGEQGAIVVWSDIQLSY